jgi:integrase
VIKGTTANLYRQYYNAALEYLARRQKMESAKTIEHQTRIEAALARVRGRPPTRNTSSKKVRDARDWMVKAAFGHLKLMALRHDRIRLAATALYCLLQPVLGTRPIELQDARIDGDALIVRNAKRTDGSSRTLSLVDIHPTHRMALLVLLEIIKVENADVGYQRWLKTLAENLARACKAASTKENPIPRLAPSSFRHTAISTWAASGFTVDEIAEMAGHLSLLSARRYYIHEGAAWAQKRAGQVRPVVPPEIAEPETEISTRVEPIVLEDFPVPAENVSGDNTLWAEYLAKEDQESRRIAHSPSDRDTVPSSSIRRPI